MKLTSIFIRIFVLLFSASLQAKDNQQQMQFYGTLNVPPVCTINNGQVIDVDFGERIGVNKVDGKNYLRNVNYEIQCEKGGNSLELGLKVTAIAANYDDSVIQTNLTDLGIQLLLGGKPLVLNQRTRVDAAAPPTLQAVPVKRPGAELKVSDFRATATLTEDYQ